MQPRTTFSRFITEDQRRKYGDPNLVALLNDVQSACKLIASYVARASLDHGTKREKTLNVHGEHQKPLDVIANEIFLRECEWGGHLAGVISEEMAEPYVIPPTFSKGDYLLVFDPVDGSSNFDVNVTVGSIFSILRSTSTEVDADTFLQAGKEQVAAGFALYGPASMIVLTLGEGVFGFTLDPQMGVYTLTHPFMTIPNNAHEFAINASNERFWEPPVRCYVAECVQGKSGPRGADFNMRWIASLVAEVYRILIRGGVFMYPRDKREPLNPGRLRLLYEANPMAMIIEQAGGLASTGRERILDIVPSAIHQKVPLILGSACEVERVCSYHATYDRGEALTFATPLFNQRSLLRATP